MNISDVAVALNLPPRDVERLAKRGELRGRQVKDQWEFRAGAVTKWAAANVHSIFDAAAKRSALCAGDFQLARSMDVQGIGLFLPARTKVSVLYALVTLVGRVVSLPDWRPLLEALVERERQGSTALPCGVAIPHTLQTTRIRLDRPVVVAGRTPCGIPFGDPSGGLTDLFFLICCPDYREHLLHLGRLCVLLKEQRVRTELRECGSPERFLAILRAEESATRQEADRRR